MNQKSVKIKTYLKQLHNSNSFLGRAVYFSILRVWLSLKFILNARYRSEKLTRKRYPNEMIQTSAATSMNRYPRLFDITARELADISQPQILSFGCSTGEEVFSISKHIPNATITGVEINLRSLSVARKKNKSRQHQFFHFNNVEWQKKNHYDCIMALAVFQRSEHREKERTESLAAFQFQQFSDRISQLDGLLKKNGILILDNLDYSFQDLKLSKRYVVSDLDTKADKPRPVYSKKGIKTSSSSKINRVFKKIN